MIRNVVFAAFAALSLAGVARAEEAAGKPAQVAVCAACHGETGVSKIPMYPILAGQQRNYIEHALHEYKSGARKNPIMAAQASALSDADIKALAAWYSSQTAVLYTISSEGEAAPKAPAAKPAADKKD